MKQSPFLCLMRRRFWAFRSWGNPAVVIIVLIVLIVTPIPELFCYQKFINYAGWLCLTFLNKYVIIIVIAMSFVSCCDFNYFSEILDLSPECADAGTFPAPRKKSDKSAHRLQQGVILWWLYLGTLPLNGLRCNQIIVRIVTGCLNKATFFSLFNATKIQHPERETDQSFGVFNCVIIQ